MNPRHPAAVLSKFVVPVINPSELMPLAIVENELGTEITLNVPFWYRNAVPCLVALECPIITPVLLIPLRVVAVAFG
jgi:hypothetical protein